MNILLIEDERGLALAMIRVLGQTGAAVTWKGDGESGLAAALMDHFDVIILDVLLPQKNGYEVCAGIRDAGLTTPVLMLTAMDELEDKLAGFRAGADDYLAKLFEVPELLARVEALSRRHVNRGLTTRIADLEVDRHTRKVRRAGRQLDLSRREYDLLEVLASNVGDVVSKDTLQRRVWTDDESFSNSVDVFLATLRKKVDAPAAEPLIHAQKDGYVLARPRALV